MISVNGTKCSTPVLALLLFLGGWVHCPIMAAQSCGLERVLPFSSAQVEAALRSLHAYSGDQLPTLEGFAAVSGTPLNLFKRGYFVYSLQLASRGGAQTSLRVCANITARLESADGTSGYRQLASNGRLEADLFDRLDETLKTLPRPSVPSSSLAPASGQGAALTSSLRDQPTNSTHTSPSATAPATQAAVPADVFAIPNPKVIPSYTPYSVGPALTPSEQRAIQSLTMQARGLEQILSSQSHPDNLVSVRRTRSPIFERPAEGAKVLLYADANDEFEKVSESVSWVKVQLSGPAQGWIRRSLLEAQLSGSKPALPSAQSSSEKADHITEQVSLFPGKWPSLDGQQVEIVSVTPTATTLIPSKKSLSASIFRKTYLEISKAPSDIAGVVIIFDAADGLMVAATKESLQQWDSGHLSNSAFWKQCYLDPKDAFKAIE